MRRVLCAVAAIFALGPAPATLAPQLVDRQPLPVFRSRVDVVVLDVSVLDDHRRPVRGLTAADFSVLEDGRPQSITMFSAVDVPDPVEPSAQWVKEVAADVRSNEDDSASQIFVLVLDDASPMSAGDMIHARQYARSVIDGLSPNDLAAVVFLAYARSGQELTHDRGRLLAAVERFSGVPPPIPGFPQSALQLLGPTMALRTLKGQAEVLQELPAARKALIFISTRGAAVPDSLTGLGDAEGQEAAPGQDVTGMVVQNFGEFGEFVRAAQRANLNVYCLDPGGLRAPEAQRAPIDSSATTVYVHNPNVTGIASLDALSRNTGGFAIAGTNDPRSGLTQIFRENRSYYLLAYASTNARLEGRYRHVTVRVSRPGVIVRSRGGYFEPDRKELKKRAAAAAASSPDAVLAAPVARSDIPLRLTAVPFAIGGKRQAAVAVVLAIRARATDAVARAANLAVTVNAYDYLAKLRASERFRARAVLKATPGGESTFELLTRLDLPPGRYQLRAAVTEMPEAGGSPGRQTESPVRTGSAFCDLDVPDFAGERLSLSPVMLTAPVGLRSAGGDRLRSVIPLMPTTVRQFVSSDNVRALLRLHQGGTRAAADVAITTRIVDWTDTVVFEATESIPAERFAQTRSTDHVFTLPLARLKPGPHLLTIEAKAGAVSVRRDVRFSVLATND